MALGPKNTPFKAIPQIQKAPLNMMPFVFPPSIHNYFNLRNCRTVGKLDLAEAALTFQPATAVNSHFRISPKSAESNGAPAGSDG